MSGDFLVRNLLVKHYITIVLIIVYGIKLNARKNAKDVELRFFWITLICCFLLVIEDVAESMAALDPDLRFFRIFFSVVGYALRPAAVVGMLLVICPPKHRTWKIWILCLINLAVYSTAFWSPAAFSYDRDYAFVRGPLGYCAFLAALLYMVCVLVWTWERFYDGWRRANRHDTTAYRIGGDEFVIVFVQQSEVIVAQTLEKLKRSVIRSGYSISAGYAMTKDSESVEAALRESDQNMYKEKAAYYQQKGVDRRKRI